MWRFAFSLFCFVNLIHLAVGPLPGQSKHSENTMLGCVGGNMTGISPLVPHKEWTQSVVHSLCQDHYKRSQCKSERSRDDYQ